MNTHEEWCPVRGFPYDVSSHGRVRRNAPGKGTYAGRIISPNKSMGYPQVAMSGGPGKLRQVKVHILVAETFLGERPDGAEVNHKNGDKWDNRVENLEYIPKADNIRHSFAAGLMPLGEHRKHSRLTPDIIRAIRARSAEGIPQHAVGAEFGVHQTMVGKIVNRHIWKHVA